MEKVNVKDSLIKTTNSFKQILPVIIGIIMLISLSVVAIPKSFYLKVFTENKFIDSLLGALFGSIAAGSPITSYILGGELLKQGISLIAVTAFILAWVSVGIIQLPAESYMLGKKFAITRNAFSFIRSLVVSVLTIYTLGFLC